VREWQRAAA